jgi:hypothetical protein
MGIIGFGAFQRGRGKIIAERGEFNSLMSELPRKIGVGFGLSSELEREL